MFFISRKKHTQAVGFIILTTFFWGFAAPLIKVALAGGASIWQVNFLRALLGIVFLTILWPRKERSLNNVPKKSQSIFLITIILDGLATILFGVLASITSSLNTVTLFMTAPLFAFLIDRFLWKTPIKRQEINAFFLLIVGVLFITYSGQIGFHDVLSPKSLAVGLLGGLITGIILVGLERTEHAVPVKTTAYWSLIMMVLLSMPLGLPDIFLFSVNTQGILALIALGIFVQAAATYTLDSALQYLHAGEAAVLESFQIVFVVIAGFLIGELPSLLQFAGAAMIAGASALVARWGK